MEENEGKTEKNEVEIPNFELVHAVIEQGLRRAFERTSDGLRTVKFDSVLVSNAKRRLCLLSDANRSKGV